MYIHISNYVYTGQCVEASSGLLDFSLLTEHLLLVLLGKRGEWASIDCFASQYVCQTFAKFRILGEGEIKNVDKKRLNGSLPRP